MNDKTIRGSTEKKYDKSTADLESQDGECKVQFMEGLKKTPLPNLQALARFLEALWALWR